MSNIPLKGSDRDHYFRICFLMGTVFWRVNKRSEVILSVRLNKRLGRIDKLR